MATSIRTSAEHEVEALLTQLHGQPFLQATLSYGNELRLHVGSMSRYRDAKPTGRSRGSWVLSMRATPWLLTRANALVARAHDDPDNMLQEFKRLEGVRIKDARVRDSDASLMWEFDGGWSFIALTEPARSRRGLMELWELLTPEGTALVAEEGGVLRIERPGDAAARPPAVHTVPHSEGWANRRAGSKRVSNTAATKAEAVALGRKMAQSLMTDHLIHRRDGTISERNSYGTDPRRAVPR